MNTDYQLFLASKHPTAAPAGFEVAPDAINPALFPFQREIVRWALWLGKAALFEERGLGKTLQELEWSRLVAAFTGRPVLNVAPLAVAKMTVSEESAKFGYESAYVANQTDVEFWLRQGQTRIFVTNFENLANFDPDAFAGVVIDESSALKNFTGATKRLILSMFKATPYKLCGSATPAPNDHLELGNHAEFLDVMPSNEMIARWFINDSMKAGHYRLKGHAEKDFWRWLTSWAVCISKPRDLGNAFDMPGYDLPPLHIIEHLLPAGEAAKARAQAHGKLYADDSVSATKLHAVRRESLPERIALARSIADTLPPDDYLTLWCDLNDESAALALAFPDALEVRGSHSPDFKEKRLLAFTRGEARQIITKAEIAGLGLNWQHCNAQIHAGLNFSFEMLYQKIGRSYRFGQTRDVFIHLITSETEGNVVEAVRKKQAQFQVMQQSMNAAMTEYGLFRDDDRRNLISSLGAMPMILPDWLKTKGVA